MTIESSTPDLAILNVVPLLVVDKSWVTTSFNAREIKMLRLTFLFVLLMSALFGISENAHGQALSLLDDIEPIARPQLEMPAEDADDESTSDALDPLDPRNEIDDDDETEDDAAIDEDDDFDSDLDLETEPGNLMPERLTDERIRENWPRHSMSEIGLSLAEVGRVPQDRSELLEGFGRTGPVGESVKVFAWEAPNIRFQPLYFEDVVLERYGQTLTDYRQGIRSAVRFGVAFTGLSLQLLETNPRSCDHPLGYCRPGTCVPQTTQRHFFGAFSLR